MRIRFRFMGVVYERVKKFFQDDGWRLQADGVDVLHTSCRGAHGEWACEIHTREEPPQVIMYSQFSFTVPSAMRAAVAEYLVRANYGLIVGNFEADLDTGDVRYKTSVDAGSVTSLDKLLRPVVYANVQTMDQYWPGLLAVMFHGDAPDAAIAAVEQSL